MRNRAISLLSALKCRIFLSAFLVFSAAALHAAVPAGFDAGNGQYDKGDFKAARSSYEALAKTGNWSANLFYNLGNADCKEGDKGAAFVAYERALVLEPKHPEATANLNLLRQETGAQTQEKSALAKIVSWPEDATGRRAAWIAAICFWALCFSFLPALFPGAGGKRRPAWIPAFFAIVFGAWSVAALAWEQSQGGTWIVTEKQVSARVAPADSSEIASSLPMGSQVRLLLERGPWLYVLLPSQGRGWIARSAAEPVIPPQTS